MCLPNFPFLFPLGMMGLHYNFALIKLQLSTNKTLNQDGIQFDIFIFFRIV